MNCRKRCTCRPSLPSLPLDGDVAGSYVLSNEWIVPACGQTATVVIPNVSFIPIGTFIYHPTYGYFKIKSVDYLTRQVSIENPSPCIPGNKPAGTPVPINSMFILTTSPKLTGFIDFEPVVTPRDPAMTISDQTFAFGKYQIDNEKCFYTFDTTFTIGGVAGDQVLYWKLPEGVTRDEDTFELRPTYAINGDGVRILDAYQGYFEQKGSIATNSGWVLGSSGRLIINGWFKTVPSV